MTINPSNSKRNGKNNFPNSTYTIIVRPHIGCIYISQVYIYIPYTLDPVHQNYILRNRVSLSSKSTKKTDCIYNSCTDHEQKSTPFGSKAKAALQTQVIQSRKKQKSSSLWKFFLKPYAIFKRLRIQKKILEKSTLNPDKNTKFGPRNSTCPNKLASNGKSVRCQINRKNANTIQTGYNQRDSEQISLHVWWGTEGEYFKSSVQKTKAVL